jgi:hypothetical protein
MDISKMSVAGLRVLIKCIQSSSMGVKDIMLVHAIEDEIARRVK